jgi:hypothetical protein
MITKPSLHQLKNKKVVYVNFIVCTLILKSHVQSHFPFDFIQNGSRSALPQEYFEQCFGRKPQIQTTVNLITEDIFLCTFCLLVFETFFITHIVIFWAVTP